VDNIVSRGATMQYSPLIKTQPTRPFLDSE